MMPKSVYLLLAFILTGCNRYEFQVNERTIFTPAALLSAPSIVDEALSACMEQTIEDFKITRIEQFTRLNCSHAGIQSLEGLQQFTALVTVNLADNDLVEVKPLLFLGALKEVNLDENPHLHCDDASYLREKLEVDVTAPTHCQ